LNRALPAELQRVEVAARPGNGYRLIEITLLVDGQPVGRGSGSVVRGWWPLSPGRHVVQAVSVDQQGQSLRSPPVEVVVEE
jgi:hypothetical protein